MKLNVKAMGMAVGVLWGCAVLVIGLANLIWPGYAVELLDDLSSIYPGYEVGGFGSVIVGTLYALVDGWIAGAILAWLYNRFRGTGTAA